MSTWVEKHCMGVVLYDFTANGQFQISLKQGEKVEVLKESSGWFKGVVVGRDAKGIFPVSFIELKPDEPVPAKKATTTTTSTTNGEPASPRGAPGGSTPASPRPSTAPPEAKKPAETPKMNGNGTTATTPASPTANGDRAKSPERSKSPEKSSPAPDKAAAPKADSAAKPQTPKPPTTLPPSSPRASTMTPHPPPQRQDSVVKNTASPTAAAAEKPKEKEPVKIAESLESKKPAEPKKEEKKAPSKKGKKDFKALGGLEQDEEGTKLKENMSLEALFAEMAHTMRDWNMQLKSTLTSPASTAPAEYQRGMERMSALLALRQKLQDPATSEDSRESQRLEVIHLIEKSRRMAEGYMVPRNVENQIADATNTGVIELLHAHRTMYNTLKDEASTMWTSHSERKETKSLVKRGSQLKIKSSWPAGHLQLYLDVKMCIFSVGEATELFFALYSNTQKRFITEDYVLNLTAAGMPENLKLLGKMQTFFKDLDAKDMDSDLYLVCRIYRRALTENLERAGRLVADPTKKKPPSRLYRRPFGCAAMELSSCGLDQQMGKEYQPPNAAMTIYTHPNENNFAKIHEQIIAKDKSLEPASKAKGIALGLIMFNGELDAVRKTDEKQFAEPPVTNKLDFPEIMNPGEIRNDFYAFLLGGSFSQGNKTSSRNIELSVKVLNDRGESMETAIVRGAGDAPPSPEYRTTVYYHNNNPLFDETIRIQIPGDDFEKCHLFLTFWHVSTSTTLNKTAPFAFGFLPLAAENGAVIPDEEYKVAAYKPFSKLEEKDGTIGAFYLKKEALNPQSSGSQKLVPLKEFFSVKTRLCSNKKTQNATLHSLFKWKTLDSGALKLNLEKFCTSINRANLHELSKFVRETFDVFFSVLSSKNLASLNSTVYHAILHMLSLLTDKKLAQFRPLVDSYIKNVFADANAHNTLTKLTVELLTASMAKPDIKLVTLTKCLHYVIKFIIASRTKDLATGSPSCDQKTFKSNLASMVKAFNGLVSVEEKKDEKKSATMALTFQAQSYVLRGFPGIVKDLQSTFDSAELGQFAKDLLQCIPSEASQNVGKLNLIRALFNGPIGDHAESRAIISPLVLGHMSTHLRAIDSSGLTEPYLCVAILCKMLTVMQTKNNFDVSKMWDWHGLLPDLVRVVLRVHQSNKGEVVLKPPPDTVTQSCKVDMPVDSVTLLWAIVNTMSDDQFRKFIATLNTEQLKSFMEEILQVCSTIVQLPTPLYHELWLMMNMLQLAVIVRLMERFSDPMQKRLFSYKVAEFPHRIWQRWFELAIVLLSSSLLHLENFTKQKREFITARHGDLRRNIMAQFRTMWAALQSQKKLFYEVLVSKLFDVARKYEGDLRKFALDIYYDMAATEFKETGAFDNVERHTIDALYTIAGGAGKEASGGSTETKESKDASGFIDLLFNTMKEKFEADGGKVSKPGMEYLNHIYKMYGLMASLLKFPNTATYEDERTSVALKLMNYLESSGHVRKDMYSRYVLFLAELHRGLKSFVEAGMTNMDQIRILDWSDQVLGRTTFEGYPEETERARKEKLYRAAITDFVDGEDYERAIARCDELRVYYQSIYDYDKLAAILVEQADYFRKVLHTERFYSNYFRVCYHGEGFDEEIREKEFVYRGVKLEPVMDFTNRIKKKWPDAKVLMSSDKPSDDLYAQHKQIISVTTLVKPTEQERFDLTGVNGAGEKKVAPTPVPVGLRGGPKKEEKSEEKLEVKAERSAPVQIQRYRENNDLRMFTYSKAIQKSTEKKPANEHKTLWVTKTFIFTKDPFPANRRRMEVVERKEAYLSPIEVAVTTMVNKNQDLETAIDNVEKAPPGPVDVGPLSMLLNGMIDAAVNGGTGKYIEAFLTDEFMQTRPPPDSQQLQFRQELKQSLRDQISFLKKGLTVFGQRCDQRLKGLFDHLSGFYEQMVTKTKPVVA